MSRMEFRATLRQLQEELTALRSWREGIDKRVQTVEQRVSTHSTAVAAVVWMGGVLAAIAGTLAAVFK